MVRGCPPGLGDPVFDKLDATLAHAMMSIPATKAFAVGSGFEAADMTGLEHNDPFYMRDGHVHTVTNHSGGIQGGISNGEDILMRIGFKPTATLMVDQQTVNQAGEDARLKGRGRHDACVLPRAVPIVEAMAWLCLCDHYLRQRCQRGCRLHGSGLTLAIRYPRQGLHSHVLLRLNHCHVSKYTAPRWQRWRR